MLLFSLSSVLLMFNWRKIFICLEYSERYLRTLNQDNTSFHTAALIKEFLTKTRLELMSDLPWNNPGTLYLPKFKDKVLLTFKKHLSIFYWLWTRYLFSSSSFSLFDSWNQTDESINYTPLICNYSEFLINLLKYNRIF